MSLWNYENAFRHAAAEFADWSNSQDRERARAMLQAEGPLQLWQGARAADLKALTTLLGLSETPFRNRWQKIPAEHRPLTLLRLQYLAIQAANEAQRAQSVLDVTGLGYREALKRVAPSATAAPLAPSKDDLRDALGWQ